MIAFILFVLIVTVIRRRFMKKYSTCLFPQMFFGEEKMSFPFNSDFRNMSEEEILKKRLASGEIDAEGYSEIMDIRRK